MGGLTPASCGSSYSARAPHSVGTEGYSSAEACGHARISRLMGGPDVSQRGTLLAPVHSGLLGDHRDAAVARPVLREIGVAARLEGESGFTYGLLHQQQTDARRLSEATSHGPGGTCDAGCVISPRE